MIFLKIKNNGGGSILDNEKQEKLVDSEQEKIDYTQARYEKILELEILKQSVEEQKELAQNYYDQLVRLKADFENYRRRSEREKQDYLDWGKEKILIKQIDIADVLQQALKSAKAGSNIESIVVGLEMISKEFTKMLKDEGVEEIVCEKFDPNICEALDSVETEQEDGKVLEIYQNGYKMNGKLIRTVKVKVAKNDKKNEQED
ncbi:MAG: nucleotide exchange factor GrpE [Endomicrobium sp.]|jgi:molecular chaperone GrpE|nr:nucleotide exchange factor GrpE [Endomicrobium sp.]